MKPAFPFAKTEVELLLAGMGLGEVGAVGVSSFAAVGEGSFSTTASGGGAAVGVSEDF